MSTFLFICTNPTHKVIYKCDTFKQFSSIVHLTSCTLTMLDSLSEDKHHSIAFFSYFFQLEQYTQPLDTNIVWHLFNSAYNLKAIHYNYPYLSFTTIHCTSKPCLCFHHLIQYSQGIYLFILFRGQSPIPLNCVYGHHRVLCLM